MYYKRHIDMAHVEGGRRDYSFTIFLNNPSDYDGGELILNVPPENKSIKLNAGSIIIYPTKYMHEVKEVTRGERIVCVGWIESCIKRDEEREILALTQIARSHAIIANNGSSIPDLEIVYQRLIKYFAD
jgi:PKHD-type hydroxylase